jgi:hypothetical protein
LFFFQRVLIAPRYLAYVILRACKVCEIFSQDWKHIGYNVQCSGVGIFLGIVNDFRNPRFRKSDYSPNRGVVLPLQIFPVSNSLVWHVDVDVYILLICGTRIQFFWLAPTTQQRKCRIHNAL